MISDLLDATSQMSWPKLFAGLLLIGLGLVGFAFYELYTHSARLNRVEHALSVAEKAQAYLRAVGNKPTRYQLEIYGAAIAEAHAAATEAGTPSSETRSQQKFLTGLLPWILMALVFVGDKEQKSFTGMFGSIVIGIIAGSVLAYLPDFWWPIGSLGLAPGVTWLVIVAAFSIVGRRGKAGVQGAK
jgi:hypothetical protein